MNDLARRLLGGTRFTEAGTADYVYEATVDKIEAKAAFYAPAGASVRYTFTKGEDVIYTETLQSEASKSLYRRSATLKLEAVRPDRIRVELMVGETVVDLITHPILCLGEENTATEPFVTVENGVFMKDGKPLHLIGVNYFGCYGGIVPSCSFTSESVYDPYLVRCDLERIQEIGFNAIAVQIAPWADAKEVAAGTNRNMTQVIAIARELGLYVDIYVPFEDNMTSFGKLVKNLHLSEFDNLVAYDINWEGSIGTYASLSASAKKARDTEWVAWVKKQYGSLDAASASLGMTCPENADFDTLLATKNASPAEVKLAAAFRRFMDDKVSAYYAASSARIKQLDPNHLVSFRCCDAGLPSAVNSQNYYYDFSGFCGALDFVSPEGYGFTSYQYNATAHQGAFAAAYARLVCGNTTTVWKEFGWQCYSGNNYKPLEPNMEYCADIYEKVYNALLMGQGGGSYAWWYAGGLRADEGSDYGVVNPDGSDRPATQVVRQYIERLVAIAPVTQADVTITVDRDQYADGLAGIWRAVESQFKFALASDKTVALVSDGSTMTVEEAAKLALDGTESTIGPRKYLNCVISYAADANGKEVASGGKCTTEQVTLTLANTGYTSWQAGDATLCDAEGNVLATLPALAQGERTAVTVTLPSGGAQIRACADGILFGTEFVIKK